MRMCDDGHDEIVHDGRYQSDCPLCEATVNMRNLEDERDALKESNKHLEAVVEKLEEDE